MTEPTTINPRVEALAKAFDAAVQTHDTILRATEEPPTTLQEIVEALAVVQAGIYQLVEQKEPVTIGVDDVAVTISKVSE